MKGFRSLAEGEEVEMEIKMSGKGAEATLVTAPGGLECTGSARQQSQERRPIPNKKKFRKIRYELRHYIKINFLLKINIYFRCYNCGEFANHVASKCTMGPLPKRCHQCKSQDHLIADCPERPERGEKTTTETDPSIAQGDSH